MLKKPLSSILGSRRTKEIEEQLKAVLMSKVPFLQGADDALISDLAAAIEPVKYSKGETIFREGDPGDSFFLIVDGAVRVSNKGEFIAELGVGGCFGEGALLKDEVRSATVVASEETKVTLYKLKKELFTELTEKYMKVRYRLRQLDESRRAEDIENSIERNLLQNAPFLMGAGGDLINELAQVLERKKYAKGEVLIREGDAGNCFYLIEEGIVGISKGSSQIAELGPGACIGEGAFCSLEPCSATVTALAETACFVLEKRQFHGILRRYPVIGHRLQAIHAERMKQSSGL
jgi:CRP-like cAMP-binding protein